jgi:HSP20 family protein
MFNRYVNDFDRSLAVMDQLRRRMDRAFEEFDDRFGARSDDGPETFPPAVLKDQGAELMLEVELPGVAETDVALSIHQETLTLTGERKSDAPEGYFVHRRERAPLKFAKTIGLPCKVDPDKSSAVLKNGVMTVRLAKVPDAQPRRISIQAN